MADETHRDEQGRFQPLDKAPMDVYNRVRDAGKDSIEKEDEGDFEPSEPPTGREGMKEYNEKRDAQQRGRGGVEKRIGQLIKDRAELRAKLARFESGEQANGQAADGKPSEWEPSEEEKANTQKKQDRFHWRLEEARKKHEDFKELQEAAAEIKVTPAMAGQIIDLDNGAEVAIYLARHPEIARDLHRNPRAAQKELDYISRLLEEESRQDSLAEKIGKVVSRAPEPIKPVVGGSTKSSKRLDEMQMMAEYNAARDKGRIR